MMIQLKDKGKNKVKSDKEKDVKLCLKEKIFSYLSKIDTILNRIIPEKNTVTMPL